MPTATAIDCGLPSERKAPSGPFTSEAVRLALRTAEILRCMAVHPIIVKGAAPLINWQQRQHT